MTVERDGFARIPDWLTRHAVPALGLTAAEGLAYVAVRSRAGMDGLAWPSYPTIAHETGTSESTAARAVKRLVQVGLLEVAEEGRQHQATVYRVVERPTLPPKPDRPLSKSERRRAQAPHRGEPGTQNPPHLDAQAPHGDAQAPHGDAQAPHGGVLRLLTVGSEVDTVKKTQEVDTGHNNASPRRSMTSPQRENVLDALLAVAGRCESIDVMQFRDAELAHLDGLSAADRDTRVRVWAGLRSRALTDAGDDLVEDHRLHDLLSEHGYVWDGGLTTWPTRVPGEPEAWTAPRKESA